VVALAKWGEIVQENAVQHSCVILAEAPGALVKVAGIPVLERLLRTLQRAGLKRAIVLSNDGEVARMLSSPSRHRAELAIEIHRRQDEPVSGDEIAEIWPNDCQHLLVLRGDFVFDTRLLELIDNRHASAALIDSAPPENLAPLLQSLPPTRHGYFCGAALLSREWVRAHSGALADAIRNDIATGRMEGVNIASHSWHSASMRRDLRPYWFPAPSPAHCKTAERMLRDAAQKGALDFPALVHAPIENFLIERLCKTPVTPNQLTFFTNIAASTATFLFATGQLAWGVVVALSVGVLDGLDGKQARVKVETSRAGKLEHILDAIFENSWWLALAWYLHRSGELKSAFFFLFLLGTAEAGAAFAKWSSLRFLRTSLYELSRFDLFVRLIGARRNVHIWILALGVLLGHAAVAFIVMAWWEVATSVIQLSRVASVLCARARLNRRAALGAPGGAVAAQLSADASLLDDTSAPVITNS
jgi:phosphatidylglycerophosphate synthase